MASAPPAEVTVLNAPSAPEVTIVARLPPTLVTSVAKDSAPAGTADVTSVKTDPAPSVTCDLN